MIDLRRDDPQVGDIVSSAIPWLDVYEIWGSKSLGFPKKINEFTSRDIGLVLESLEKQGGNGCKILFQGDKIGWVNFNLLKRL